MCATCYNSFTVFCFYSPGQAGFFYVLILSLCPSKGLQPLTSLSYPPCGLQTSPPSDNTPFVNSYIRCKRLLCLLFLEPLRQWMSEMPLQKPAGELWNSINQVETSQQHFLCQTRSHTMPSLSAFFQFSNRFLDLQIWSLMLHCLASFVREREPRRRGVLQTGLKANIIPSRYMGQPSLPWQGCCCVSLISLYFIYRFLFLSLHYNFLYLSLLFSIHPFQRAFSIFFCSVVSV